MLSKIKIYVGFDPRESVVYHTFTQSLIEKSTLPIEITPLAVSTLNFYEETHQDKSNDFVYSRFLTPYMSNFDGLSIYVDGDMICQADIKELIELRDESKAVQVVKHNYKTKAKNKYLDNKNENYPRKNWSSVILWNCAHPKHKILTPDFINKQTGKFLHRFSWLENEEIGELPIEWNWLAIEYPKNPLAKLIHYTLGAPCFKDYRDTSMAENWLSMQKKICNGMDID